MSVKDKLRNFPVEALNFKGWSHEGEPLPRKCCLPECNDDAQYGKVGHWWCRDHWLMVTKLKAEDV